MVPAVKSNLHSLSQSLGNRTKRRGGGRWGNWQRLWRWSWTGDAKDTTWECVWGQVARQGDDQCILNRIKSETR